LLKKIIFIGHSHIRAIEAAALRLEPKIAAHFIDLNAEAFRPAARLVADKIVVNEALVTSLAEIRAEGDCHVALSVGGAMHNVLGLAKHPDPFQFLNPWKESRIIDGMRVLPFELVRRVLEDSLVYQLMVFRGLARNLGHPLVQLQSPPPVPSEEALQATPGVYGEAIRQFGIVDANSRYAWWRIQSDAFERTAKEEGVEFLHAPAHCVAEDGFLKKEAWRDPTHGNVWYGEQVLHQVQAYFEKKT